MAGEFVVAAQPGNDPGVEWPVHAGSAAGGVELVGDLGVGVIVEEAVDQREGVGVGLARLPGVQRDRGGEAVGLAAAEADVQVGLCRG